MSKKTLVWFVVVVWVLGLSNMALAEPATYCAIHGQNCSNCGGSSSSSSSTSGGGDPSRVFTGGITLGHLSDLQNIKNPVQFIVWTMVLPAALVFDVPVWTVKGVYYTIYYGGKGLYYGTEGVGNGIVYVGKGIGSGLAYPFTRPARPQQQASTTAEKSQTKSVVSQSESAKTVAQSSFEQPAQKAQSFENLVGTVSAGAFGTQNAQPALESREPNTGTGGTNTKAGDQLMSAAEIARQGGDLTTIYDAGTAKSAGSLVYVHPASSIDTSSFSEAAKKDPLIISTMQELDSLQAKRSRLENERDELIRQRNSAGGSTAMKNLDDQVQEKNKEYQANLSVISEKIEIVNKRKIDLTVTPKATPAGDGVAPPAPANG